MSITADLSLSSMSLAPQLIIFRVAMGRSWTESSHLAS